VHRQGVYVHILGVRGHSHFCGKTNSFVTIYIRVKIYLRAFLKFPKLTRLYLPPSSGFNFRNLRKVLKRIKISAAVDQWDRVVLGFSGSQARNVILRVHYVVWSMRSRWSAPITPNFFPPFDHGPLERRPGRANELNLRPHKNSIPPETVFLEV